MIADCLEISVYNFLILVIWFNTNAFVEYCYILNIEKLTKAEEFTNFNIDNNISLHYTGFLQLNYDNFFTRLISCPICLCFWLNIFYLLNSTNDQNPLPYLDYFQIEYAKKLNFRSKII